MVHIFHIIIIIFHIVHIVVYGKIHIVDLLIHIVVFLTCSPILHNALLTYFNCSHCFWPNSNNWVFNLFTFQNSKLVHIFHIIYILIHTVDFLIHIDQLFNCLHFYTWFTLLIFFVTLLLYLFTLFSCLLLHLCILWKYLFTLLLRLHWHVSLFFLFLWITWWLIHINDLTFTFFTFLRLALIVYILQLFILHIFTLLTNSHYWFCAQCWTYSHCLFVHIFGMFTLLIC